MGGVLQTIKFLAAAGGVGLCLKGLDNLAQSIDEGRPARQAAIELEKAAAVEKRRLQEEAKQQAAG